MCGSHSPSAREDGSALDSSFTFFFFCVIKLSTSSSFAHPSSSCFACFSFTHHTPFPPKKELYSCSFLSARQDKAWLAAGGSVEVVVENVLSLLLFPSFSFFFQ